MTGRLPGKADLEREFLAGATYAQLARKYGVQHPQTVLTTMKRRARREGTRWPLKRDSHLFRQRLSSVCSETRWDGITAVMVRAEILEAVKTLGVTRREIARRSGVGERTVYEVSTGVRQRISRATAQRIMRAIEALEKSHPSGIPGG